MTRANLCQGNPFKVCPKPPVAQRKCPHTGEVFVLCQGHIDVWDEQTACLEGIVSKSGPYAGKVGSKGGGASALMADKLMASGKMAQVRRDVLRALAGGPLTPEQASRKAGYDVDLASPHVSELKAMGAVCRYDMKGKSERNNRCGRYGLTDAGRAFLQEREAA